MWGILELELIGLADRLNVETEGEDVYVEMESSVLSQGCSLVTQGEVPHRQLNCGFVNPGGNVNMEVFNLYRSAIQ